MCAMILPFYTCHYYGRFKYHYNETLVNFLIKVMMSFHVKYNGLVMNEERIQVIDKFKSLFIKWGRFIYLTGCIILIVGCMFS